MTTVVGGQVFFPLANLLYYAVHDEALNRLMCSTVGTSVNVKFIELANICKQVCFVEQPFFVFLQL